MATKPRRKHDKDKDKDKDKDSIIYKYIIFKFCRG